MSERQIRWLLGGLGAGCFVILMMLEFLTDPERQSVMDLAGEALNLLLIIGAAVGVALLVGRIEAQHEAQVRLLSDLATARAEGERWRETVATHLAELRAEIDAQFDSWGMTGAEQEVGRLLLKGLSHKEIATLRATSDATVRQQAQSIYRKAGLPGRTAFSAYFLDDLFQAAVLPATGRAATPAPRHAQRSSGAEARLSAPPRDAG